MSPNEPPAGDDFTKPLQGGIEFRVGYTAIRNLREEELAAIPYFVRVALIWSMGIHARAVGILLPRSWMNDRLLEQRLQQLRAYEKADH